MQPQSDDLVLGSRSAVPTPGSAVLGGFASLQQRLQNPQPAQRLAALRTIAQSYLPLGLPTLIHALNDDDRQVQTLAYQLLRQSPYAEAQTALLNFPHYRLFQPIFTLLGHAHPIKAVALGRRQFQYRDPQPIAISADSLGLIIVWDTSTGTIVEQLQTWTFAYGLDYDTERDWVLIRTPQAQLIAWSLKTLQEVDLSADQTLENQTFPTISGIASTCVINDRYLAFSNQRSIKIWDKSTAKEIAILSAHRALVNAIAISADQQYLLSGSEDKTAILWGLISA